MNQPDPKKRRTTADQIALQNKYGDGTKHRDVYMDFYDKELPETTVQTNYKIWEKDPYIKDKALEYQNQYFANEEAEKNWTTNFHKSMRSTPNLKDYSKDNEMSLILRQYSDEELQNNKQYQTYVAQKLKQFSDRRYQLEDQFNNDPSTKRIQKSPATSLRNLIEPRSDIEDKSLFAASILDEGGDVFINQYEGGTRDTFSGYGAFGLDTFGDRFDEFVKRGYIDKDMRNRIKLKEEINEKGEKVTSADFFHLSDVVTAKNAFIKAGKNNILKKARELGVNLSKTAQRYFTIASYNMGEGGARQMLESYYQKGLLENDKFMASNYEATDWKEPHRNAKRRLQAMNMLEGEGVIK